MGDIISWLLFGLIAGAIAKALHPGKDPGGWIITIVIGIVGSIIGGFIGRFLGWGGTDGSPWHFRPFILSVVGAIILLWIYNMMTRKRVA